ncbi:MAG TPA: alpha/beta hydrolase [Solimonas sp.]|nr:alpha/beta hydrolase [Solimonas sp.]
MSLLLLGLPLLLVAGSLLGSRWIERRYPPVGEFIEVDGVRLHYLSAGQGPGPALLLVHGASSNLRDFQASILPELAKRHRVIAFDRPGYGYSQRPAGDWPDPARVARLLLDASSKLGADQPILVGHSWAGSVVMSALVEMPERVSGGVLLSGVAGHWVGSVGWTYDAGSVPVLGQLFAWTTVLPAGQLMLGDAVVPVLAPSPVPDGYVERIGAPLALRPRSFLNNVQDMTRLSEYMQHLSPRYDRIRLPLLIIHGEADTLVPYWNHGRRLRPVIPQAQAVLIPDGGHALQHSHPREVVQAIEGFLPAQ